MAGSARFTLSDLLASASLGWVCLRDCKYCTINHPPTAIKMIAINISIIFIKSPVSKNAK